MTKKKNRAAPAPTLKPVVLFATDRNDEFGDLNTRFGIKRSEDWVLSCGEVVFSTQFDREVGEAHKGELSLAGGRLHTGKADCSRFVAGKASVAGSKSVILFVHGYRNTFEESLRRAISFAEDINYDGVILIWSWPSAGHGGLYFYDGGSAAWSSPHFADFLPSLKDIRDISIFTHSMGARLGLAALNTMLLSGTPGLLRIIVFAAPDEDRDVFIGAIKASANVGRSRHLYASSRDTALKTGAKFNQSPRAGLGGEAEIVVTPALESMDASDLKPGPWGHSYVFVSRKGLGDIRLLLLEGKKAVERGLTGKPKGAGEYYTLTE